MHRYFLQYRNLLSGKKITFLIIFWAISVRVIQVIFFFNFRVDGMYQAMAMQNFVHGHGFSISYASPLDISTIIYEPLINWPPGYSLLLSPFYILFDHNITAAGISVEIIFAILLIFIGRSILKILDIPLYLINIFTLLTAPFIYYFYFIASSDASAITLFLIAVYYLLKLIKEKKISLKISAGIIVPLFMSGLIKYLFIPIVFILPFFLLLTGIRDKAIKLKKAAYTITFILFILFSALLIYQKNISGSAVYIAQPERGLFYENLKVAYPAIPASFVNPDSINLLMNENTVLQNNIFIFFQFIHFLLFITWGYFLIKIFLKKRSRPIDRKGAINYLTFLILCGTSLLLAFLSLRVAKEENFPGNLWTYIEEPRYYGLIVVMIHICIFVTYLYYKQFTLKILRNLFIILLLLIMPETLRGIYLTGRRVINTGNELYSWQYENDIQQYADKILINKKLKYPDRKFAVTGSSYYFYYRVGMYGHVPFFKAINDVNKPELLNTKEPVCLLVILKEEDFFLYQPFLMNKQTEFAGENNGFYFYTYNVNPR